MTSGVDAVRRVLAEEARAIDGLAERLGEDVPRALELIAACLGRVVTCGVGKSGHIGRKAASTLSSTGTPSFFLHAAEAAHGDLGMVTADDVVLMLSYSGETEELVRLLPAIKATGARIVCMTGRADSMLALGADVVLDVAVGHEACPNNLAPTSSTTAMLALTDALAIAAMERRGFGKEDFARFHPSGTLGKRLLLTVQDAMRTGDELALVEPHESVLDVMRAITRAGAGAACVVDGSRRLLGFISDGDLRRHFVGDGPNDATADSLANASVMTIAPGILAFDALEAFGNAPRKIGEMPVLDDGRVVGMLVLKDLLRIGIV